MSDDIQYKNFFVTDKLAYETWGLKGKEQSYYVTGFISTDEVDLYNEVVTKDAMKSMMGQLSKGDVKLDVEHDTFKGQADIPIGRIVDAKMVEDDGSHKIWIKASINKSHSKFQEVWKSIREGFLDAFSIAYKPLSTINKMIDGVEVRLLKTVELLNVAITGNPVNRGSKMVDSFMKSVQQEEFTEENKMSEETKPEAPVEEKPPQEPVVEEVKEEPKEEPKEEVKEEPAKPELTLDAVKEVITEAVAGVQKQVDDVKEQIAKPLDAIKSLNKDIAELKSQLEKPVLKSMQETPQAEIKVKSPMDLL